jgi:hypothetical protein
MKVIAGAWSAATTPTPSARSPASSLANRYPDHQRVLVGNGAAAARRTAAQLPACA